MARRGSRFSVFLAEFVEFLPADRLERFIRLIVVLPLFQIKPLEEVIGIRIAMIIPQNYPLPFNLQIRLLLFRIRCPKPQWDAVPIVLLYSLHRHPR